MSGPNLSPSLNFAERLKYAGAVLGAVAVVAIVGPPTDTAEAARPSDQGPHIGKAVRGSQDIGSAIAIGIRGNRPVR